MATDLKNGFLQFARLSNAALKRAMDELAVKQAAEQKAAALKQEVTTALKAITAPDQAEKAAGMLGDHAQVLLMLKNTATKLAEYVAREAKSASDLGRPVTDPAAAASVSSPFVERAGTADQRLMQGLGLR